MSHDVNLDMKEIEAVHADILSFLDSSIWNNFKFRMNTNDSHLKPNLIDKVYQEINESKISLLQSFYLYTNYDLVHSFKEKPNFNFFRMCLLSISESNIILAFVEAVISLLPLAVNDNISKHLNEYTDGMIQNITNVLIFMINYSSNSTNLQKILQNIPFAIILNKFLIFFQNFFQNMNKNSENKFNIMNFTVFFTKLRNRYDKKGQLKFISDVFNQTIQFHELPNREIISILQNIFLSNMDFIDIIKDSSFISLDKKIYGSTFEESNILGFSTLDAIKEFEKKREIPTYVINLHQENKDIFDYFVQSLFTYRKHSPYNTSAEKMIKEMEFNNMIDISIPADYINSNEIEPIILLLDSSTISSQKFAYKLFQHFHSLFYSQQSKTIKSFVNTYFQTYIKKMQSKTLNSLAEIAINFLKSELLEQHRFSLSALAIRLPIGRYLNNLFNENDDIASSSNSSSSPLFARIIAKESLILKGLHAAAIQTCSNLKVILPSKQKHRTKVQSLQFQYIDDTESEDENRVTLDRIMILRFRWRVIRGDSFSTIPFLPEFIELCDSDKSLFLKWESFYSDPNHEDRIRIFQKLGIFSNQEDLKEASELLFQILQISTPKPSFIQAFTICYNDSYHTSLIKPYIKMSEQIKLETLLNFNFLWCQPIMNNPKIYECLRNPTKLITLSLFRALRETEYVIYHNRPKDYNRRLDDIFQNFPLGFSALLSNSSEIEYVEQDEKPVSLFNAEKIVSFDSPPTPRMKDFIVVSVNFELFKQYEKDQKSTKPLKDNVLFKLCSSANELLDQSDAQRWIFYCFSFIVSNKCYDMAIEFLTRYDFLFEKLKSKVPEENLFLGHGKWSKGLFSLSNYCKRNNINFSANALWNDFIAITQQSIQVSDAIQCQNNTELYM